MKYTKENFTAIDRTPFTYYIEWSSTKECYYGVRYALGCLPSDLMTIYFTSSIYVEEKIQKEGLPDIFYVDKIFSNVFTAIAYENQYLTENINKNFLNRSCGYTPNRLCVDNNTVVFDILEEKTKTISHDEFIKFKGIRYVGVNSPVYIEWKSNNPKINTKNFASVFDIITTKVIKVSKEEYAKYKNERYFCLSSSTYKKFKGIPFKTVEVFDSKLKEIVTLQSDLFEREKNERYFKLSSLTYRTYVKEQTGIYHKFHERVTCLDVDLQKIVGITKEEFNTGKNIKYFAACTKVYKDWKFETTGVQSKHATIDTMRMKVLDIDLNQLVIITPEEYNKLKFIKYFAPNSKEYIDYKLKTENIITKTNKNTVVVFDIIEQTVIRVSCNDYNLLKDDRYFTLSSKIYRKFKSSDKILESNKMD